MTNFIQVDDQTREAIEALKAKLGDNEDTVALLAIIIMSWNQISLLYEESELRHGANVSGSASFLSRLGQSMIQLREQIDAGEGELKELHTNVMDTLALARGDIAKVSTVMKDVLQEYNEFQGNVGELKKALGSLVQASLTAFNPAIGTMASSMVNRVFNIST